MRQKKIFIPSTTDIKILLTVRSLNEMELYPLPQGVFKILKGSDEEEFSIYSNLPTFGTILSYSSKHISKNVMMLIRYNYLERIFDQNTNELYLKLSTKGDVFLLNYEKKHKYSFVKKESNKKPLIVKISTK